MSGSVIHLSTKHDFLALPLASVQVYCQFLNRPTSSEGLRNCTSMGLRRYRVTITYMNGEVILATPAPSPPTFSKRSFITAYGVSGVGGITPLFGEAPWGRRGSSAREMR